MKSMRSSAELFLIPLPQVTSDEKTLIPCIDIPWHFHCSNCGTLLLGRHVPKLPYPLLLHPIVFYLAIFKT